MKHIIVCCDGTWSKPGSKDRGQLVETNVEKLYKAVKTENSLIEQIKYYGQGLGTGMTITENLFGGGFGFGIDNSIQDAYKFLMWSYEPGDELYFFGFSRGAYTVRSLVGLIRNCGIMKPEYLHLVNEAYHLYRDRSELTHPESGLMKAFKKSYGKENETSIKFLGVWDTVGSLGIPFSSFSWLNRKYRFHDVKLSSQIKYAYHALAVDERRKFFEPALWEVSQEALERADPQISEQVWFPGVHSNIGGGYVDCGLSNITLKWMMEKAEKAGLELEENCIQQLECNSKGELRNSLVGIFRLTPRMFRTINNAFIHRKEDAKGKMTDGARIRNEKIHYTCLERLTTVKAYKPKNLQPALQRIRDYDPKIDEWLPEWKSYLNNDSTE
jgi:uncharacterized protein (DUF2235 family)